MEVCSRRKLLLYVRYMKNKFALMWVWRLFFLILYTCLDCTYWHSDHRQCVGDWKSLAHLFFFFTENASGPLCPVHPHNYSQIHFYLKRPLQVSFLIICAHMFKKLLWKALFIILEGKKTFLLSAHKVRTGFGRISFMISALSTSHRKKD